MNRRERKKGQVQTVLVESAMNLFAEKGFVQTNIIDITTAADVATGTFYNYFQSKEDIIRYILAEKIREMGGVLDEINASASSQAEKLVQISLSIGEIFEKNKNLFNLASHLPPMKSPPHGDRFKDILISVIQKGQENGEFAKDMPTNMFCEMFMATVQSALMSRQPVPFGENIRQKLNILLHGISAVL